MKRFSLCFLSILFCFLCILSFGCANETQLRVAHISDNTGALSTDYSIKVVLDTDKRVEERFVDLQIKSSEAEQFLSIGQENAEKVSVFIPKKDYWYNLTYLISQANGLDGENSYQTYDDFGNKVFNFNSKNDVELTFRVVAGKIKENADTGENILVLSEDISDEFSLKVKKHQEK